MKRGAVTKSEAKLVNVWMPIQLIPILDRAAKAEDSDRSKFIRNAIREKIARCPRK
jgi:metal-responsive CopG/Arc/MetJ family transcriptional regulator